MKRPKAGPVEPPRPSYDAETAGFYAEAAEQPLVRYCAGAPFLQRTLAPWLKPGMRILDVGTACGREVRALREAGFEAFGVEASKALVERGRREFGLGPELLAIGVLGELEQRADIEFLRKESFDAISCAAVLQHIGERGLFDALGDLIRLLKPGGSLFISVPRVYQGIDAKTQRDGSGRLFVIRSEEQYRFWLQRMGLAVDAVWQAPDVGERPGIEWTWIKASRPSSELLRPLSTIESVLRDDRKVTSYKFALIRALADLASTSLGGFEWLADGSVRVEFEAIVERWIRYYWPLVGCAEKVFQGQLIRGKQDISFRSELARLVKSYGKNGELAGFIRDCEKGSLASGDLRLIAELRRKIRQAIRSGPVRYAGNARTGRVFGASGGGIIVPGRLWIEFAQMGQWIEDSIIMRWAGFMAGLHGNSKRISVGEAVSLLTSIWDPGRDVLEAKKLYAGSSNLACVWTDTALSGRSFDVDHAIPFSLWRSNALWNLLPADPRVNNQKRDRLPSDRLLHASKRLIGESWERLYESFDRRFLAECANLAGRPLEGFGTEQREVLFAGFRQAVEITANRRGVERWEPGG